MPNRTCSTPACPLPTGRWEVCNFHRMGWTERVVVPELGPCWEWNGSPNHAGYGTVRITGQEHRKLAHRVSHQIHIGPIQLGNAVRHRCDNPPCVRPTHLIQGTHQDNMTDAVERDRVQHGESHVRAVLTEAQVIDLRSRYAAGGISAVELSRELGMSRSNTLDVLTGNRWKRAGGSIARKGAPVGENHHSAKLTAESVRMMRTMHAEGLMSVSQAAEHFGISPRSVRGIINRETWKQVS